MREILFRGKREDNDEWVYGYYVKLPDAAGTVGFMHVPASNPDEHNTAHYVALETVGQYTGLTDKKGNKIFEGDIVRTKKGKAVYSVCWSIKYCMFALAIDNDNLSAGVIGITDGSAKRVEVIGNIYDNPELIGGDE